MPNLYVYHFLQKHFSKALIPSWSFHDHFQFAFFHCTEWAQLLGYDVCIFESIFHVVSSTEWTASASACFLRFLQLPALLHTLLDGLIQLHTETNMNKPIAPWGTDKVYIGWRIRPRHSNLFTFKIFYTAGLDDMSCINMICVDGRYHIVAIYKCWALL